MTETYKMRVVQLLEWTVFEPFPNPKNSPLYNCGKVMVLRGGSNGLDPEVENECNLLLL